MRLIPFASFRAPYSVRLTQCALFRAFCPSVVLCASYQSVNSSLRGLSLCPPCDLISRNAVLLKSVCYLYIAVKILAEIELLMKDIDTLY